MKMQEKIVRLFNGKHAILYVSSKDNISYFVRAVSPDNILIGACYFSITQIFSKPLTIEQKHLYAKMHKLPFEKTPDNLEVEITKNNYHSHNIKDNKLILPSGNTYTQQNSRCDLASIDILDEKYFKTGLGSAMWKEMETIAKQHCCKTIKAHFHPHGIFQHATGEFYRRKNCDFVQEDGLTYVIKTLPLTAEKTKS